MEESLQNKVPARNGKGLAAAGLLVAALIALATWAALRETRPTGGGSLDNAATTAAVGRNPFTSHADEEHPALSPDEEAFAAALWPIHSEVKLSAVRMTFAGINFKTDHGDARRLHDTVFPLIGALEASRERARLLSPPASLAGAHADYVGAIQDYAAAAREMIRIADDGNNEHLVIAQRRSELASTALLKLSDVLWPGEYKPN